MKKYVLLTITLLCTLLLTAQQDVNLKFTATHSDGTYHAFDIISVTNITRGWNELLAYPDTTITLTYDGLQEDYIVSGLTDAYPNPFSGETEIIFSINTNGYISSKLLTISGEVLFAYNEYLEQGSHQITITMDKPQMAFLIIQTTENQYVKKILNVGYGERNNIVINKTSYNRNVTNNKSGGEFVPGDIMSYQAMLTITGNTIESEPITQAQYNSETLSLLFPTPIVSTSNVINITKNSAVSGGVVLSEGGSVVIAKGVCWSTNPNPSIIDSHTNNGYGTGVFISDITGLMGGTTYYVRAYATNITGTAYGDQKVFTTVQNDLPTIVLMAGDVWQDGTGYQMLLDADANTYGSTIPTSGPLSYSCDGNQPIYDQFEYKIPTTADGVCSTQNIVLNNSISIVIPPGTYDWCITNPAPNDKIWIAGNYGNINPRKNDYVFEVNHTYVFEAKKFGDHDGVDLTIIDNKTGEITLTKTITLIKNNNDDR